MDRGEAPGGNGGGMHPDVGAGAQWDSRGRGGGQGSQEDRVGGSVVIQA